MTTFSEVFELYRTSPKAAASRDRTFMARAQWWLPHIGHMDGEALMSDEGFAKLLGLLEDLAEGRSGSTVNRYMTAAQAVITWGRKRRLFKPHVRPFADIEKHPEKNIRDRVLTHAEADLLLAVARGAEWPLMELAVQLALSTGIRLSSQTNLRWQDVSLTGETPQLKIQRTKNGDPHIAVLTPRTVELLQAARRPGLQPDHFVFPSPSTPYRPRNWRHTWLKCLELAELEGVVWHSLRHTAATWLAESGADLREIAEFMGHRSLAMSRRYTHASVKSRANTVLEVFR